MKFMWKALVAFGCLLVLGSFGMETTVQSGTGRIYNLGLQAEQQRLLILGCFSFLAGIVLFAVVKLKQTPDQQAADKAAVEATKEKTKEELKLIGAEFGQAGQELRAAWLKAWGKVRRSHVLAVGVIVVGLTVLFPPYLITDFSGGGLKVEFPMRLFIGAKEPLMVGRLIGEIFLELAVFWVCFRKARK